MIFLPFFSPFFVGLYLRLPDESRPPSFSTPPSYSCVSFTFCRESIRLNCVFPSALHPLASWKPRESIVSRPSTMQLAHHLSLPRLWACTFAEISLFSRFFPTFFFFCKLLHFSPSQPNESAYARLLNPKTRTFKFREIANFHCLLFLFTENIPIN